MIMMTSLRASRSAFPGWRGNVPADGKAVTSGCFQIRRTNQSDTAPRLPRPSPFRASCAGGHNPRAPLLTYTRSVGRTAEVGSHQHSSGASVRKQKREDEPYRMAMGLAGAATQPVIPGGGRTEHQATADECVAYWKNTELKYFAALRWVLQ